MESAGIQPIRFFPRLDSQYHCYLLTVLTPPELRVLWFLIDKMDQFGVTQCSSNTSLVKVLCSQLNVTDQNNIRRYLRKLAQLGLIQKRSTTTYLLNPYFVNRRAICPAAIIGPQFSNVRYSDEFLAWKRLDDEQSKVMLSLKRRLHNAENREKNSQELENRMERDDEMDALKKEMQDMKAMLNEVLGILKKHEPEEAEKIERHLKLVHDE